MNDYEKWLNDELKSVTQDLYGRIEEMLNISRKYLSHEIMMELLEAAYPSVRKEEHEDHD